jgi:beta-lactamase class A
MLTRRSLLAGSSALLCSCALPFCQTAGIGPRLEAIRARVGGRVGVHALDTGSGRRIGLDDSSRYAMASTFKLLLAAFVLERCDRGLLAADQRVTYGQADLLVHAPEASKYLARGWMTVAELWTAIVTVSDNPAANLLLARVGGPAALTAFARGLGDAVTRLDRTELALNENAPGDPRDTTSPRAMVDTMQKLLLSSVLSPASRDRLISSLVASQTGLKRIRAGLPSGFRAGDKTGTGANGAVNDIAIVWPKDAAPWLIAIYMSGSQRAVDELSAAHAQIATMIVDAWT